jgi:hypothetical protein
MTNYYINATSEPYLAQVAKDCSYFFANIAATYPAKHPWLLEVLVDGFMQAPDKPHFCSNVDGFLKARGINRADFMEALSERIGQSVEEIEHYLKKDTPNVVGFEE